MFVETKQTRLQVHVAEREVQRSCWVQPERHLLEGLAFAEERSQAEGGAVAESVSKLRVPRINEELHFEVVGKVKVKTERLSKKWLCTDPKLNPFNCCNLWYAMVMDCTRCSNR